MSGSVFLNNLDDFIAPSQACVNPLVLNKNDKVSNEVSIKSKNNKIILANDMSRTEFDEVSIKPNLIKTKTYTDSRKVATVSLNDCLACSGCVTSAETVLIQEQSYEKLLSKLELSNHDDDLVNSGIVPKPKVVVSISPNSRASIAHFLGITTSECFLRIATVLKSIGVTYVIDASSGGDIALMEAREEFLKRFQEGRNKDWQKPVTTTANSSESINIFESSNSIELDNIIVPKYTPSYVGIPHMHHQIPVLTSHCPGWVCYVEKSQQQAIPYLSTVKSAQQILGTTIKSLFQEGNILSLDRNHSLLTSTTCTTTSNNNSSTTTTSTSVFNESKTNSLIEEVYFVSIQPCFDKKLESSRLDFYHLLTNNNSKETSFKEVDLVLSTTELWHLLEDEAYKVSNIQDNAEHKDTNINVLEYLMSIIPDVPRGCDEIEYMFRCFSTDGQSFVNAIDSNSSSGGYMEYIFKYATEKLFGINLWDIKHLPYVTGRNVDIAEIDLNTILLNNGTITYNSNNNSNNSSNINRNIKLKFGRAYGFRNIQSILLKLRRNNCDLDFIEVMACPSGCNNGGGQIRITNSSNSSNNTSNLVAPSESITQTKDRLIEIEQVFHHNLIIHKIENSLLIRYIYSNDRLKHPLSENALSLYHTRYHSVPKLELIAPLATKW